MIDSLPPPRRRTVRPIGVVITALALAACAAPPTDRVILLPGSQGKPTGGLSVRTAQAEQVLDRPLAEALVEREGSITAGTAKADEVRVRYGELLAVQPPRARIWTVFFELGSDRMADGATATVDEVRRALADYPAGELVLIGHTDRVGRVEDNDRLSLQRAQALKDRLVAAGFPADRVRVVGRGEREPLVPTPDETAEPRNRRVDIKLR